MQYIQIAKAFDATSFVVTPHGTSGAVTRFPPLFPAIVALLTDDATAVHVQLRYVYSSLGAINTVLLGILLALTSSSFTVAALLLTLGATSLTFLRQHLMLYTEPFFLFTELCVLLLVLPLGGWQRTKGTLLIATFFSMLGSLLRYAGISLPIMAGIITLIRDDRSWKEKLMAGTLFFFSLLPIAVWLVGVTASSDHVGGRELHFNPPTLQYLMHLASQIAGLAPLGTLLESETVRIALVMAAATIIIALTSRSQLGRAILSSIVCYLVFLVAVGSTVDSTVTFNERLLLTLLLLILVALSQLSGHLTNLTRRVFFVNFLLLLIGTQVAFQTLPLFHQSRLGLGFSSQRIANSPLLQQIAMLPPSSFIISNYPDLILLHLGRSATQIPNEFHPDTDALNTNLNVELEALAKELRSSDGYLVWFTAFKFRKYQPNLSKVQTALPSLTQAREYDIGLLYASEAQ